MKNIKGGGKNPILFLVLSVLLLFGCGLGENDVDDPLAADNQEYYYWYKGEKIALYFNKHKTFVLFDHQPDPDGLVDILGIERRKLGEVKKVKLGAILVPHSSQQIKDVNYWTVIEEEKIDLSSSIISYHSPFFYSEKGGELGLSHLFYVKLLKEEIELLEKVAKDNGVKILGNNKFMSLWFTLSCDRNSNGNALEMANLFHESKSFAASEPDLMEDALIQHVNDTRFGYR